MKPASSGNFVCAINRARDGYQVPLALHEAGLLACFVTDFYSPDVPSACLPGPLRRRRVDGLPRSATSTSSAAFVVQSAAQLLGVPMQPVFRRTDRMLGRAAARSARRMSAHLYCYAPYLPPEQLIPRGSRRAIFEFHPLPGLAWELLAADHARYPQTAWSFAQEAADKRAEREQDAWRRADAVACASSITRKSLIHAGCDPARITILPYGFDTHAALAGAALQSRGDRADFLFVGQGVQRKGLHHLIAAWQALDPADARLTLVCYRIDPGIRAMIRSPSIRLLEHQGRDALDQLYAQSDVFVMPSLLEGFGLVYLEALARGCHVVGTENSGLPDLRLPADAATVLRAGDVDSLAATIRRLAAAALAGRLDRQAITAASRRWTWADFRAGIADHARALLAA